MTIRILRGDALERLRDLPDESVHCVVTSPPYFGLRDYGMSGQIGLEANPEDFIEALVEVFREVRRVLRSDGTAWVNMGDSYANDGKWGGHTGGKHVKELHCSPIGRNKRYTGRKPKDLIGVPWLLAFALQADGWYLRQDIIWSKPNPMPESVRDRCTKAHEYIFLLAKSERYYYDQDAIMEEATCERLRGSGPMVQPGTGRNDVASVGDYRSKRNSFARETKATAGEHGQKPQHRPDREDIDYAEQRNKRSVWTVTTQPFKEAHFATFPPALIEPCILAGCPVGGTVLDPFGGAGTTGLVADRLQRDAILIELNEAYAAMAEKRIRAESPMFCDVRVA